MAQFHQQTSRGESAVLAYAAPVQSRGQLARSTRAILARSSTLAGDDELLNRQLCRATTLTALVRIEFGARLLVYLRWQRSPSCGRHSRLGARCELLSPCTVSIVAVLLHYLSIGANCHLT